MPSPVQSDVSELPEDVDGVEEVPRPLHDVVHFLEIFSQPRIGLSVEAMGFISGPAVDIKSGWDLRSSRDQKSCLALIRSMQPLYLMLSPPCTMFSQMQNLCQKNRDEQRFQDRFAEAMVLLSFSLECFAEQVKNGRVAALEHPARASSWRRPEVRALVSAHSGVKITEFDQCLMGLKTKVDLLPVRKRTRLMSNSVALNQAFGTRCSKETCNHTPTTHTWRQGAEGGCSRTSAAEVYPTGFCAAFAQAMARELGPCGHWGPLGTP